LLHERKTILESQIKGLQCDDGTSSDGPHAHSHAPIQHDSAWQNKAKEMEA
jgi:hypothetical protein